MTVEEFWVKYARTLYYPDEIGAFARAFAEAYRVNVLAAKSSPAGALEEKVFGCLECDWPAMTQSEAAEHEKKFGHGIDAPPAGAPGPSCHVCGERMGFACPNCGAKTWPVVPAGARERASELKEIAEYLRDKAATLKSDAEFAMPGSTVLSQLKNESSQFRKWADIIERAWAGEGKNEIS